jgi:hypothetical protein
VTRDMCLAVCGLLLSCVAACGSDASKQCPSCPTGQVCDQSTKTCVPSGSQCPVAGCGANATCRGDNVCVCLQGWSDCNDDLDSPTGDGCECGKACSGNQCGSSACSPATPSSCGARNGYCAVSVCKPCPSGTYNCDGLAECEAFLPCGTSTCDPTAVGVCGGSGMYCAATAACTPCPTGKYNCDFVAACESSQPCGQPTGCIQECTGSYEYLCVKDSASRCQECLESSHCRGNPRSNGPTCDTSDLAGTGSNFCLCASAADCANSTVGHLCKAVAGANPKLMTCTCDTDLDCPSPYAVCEGSLFKRCQKPCASDPDCARGVVTGTCDTATGKCTFPDI